MTFEVTVVVMRRDRGVWTSVALFLRGRTCLNEAAALAAMARRGTRLSVYGRFDGSRESWDFTAPGKPCSWILANERADEERRRAEYRAL